MKTLARMPTKPIEKHLKDMVLVIQGHLDLEGTAIIQITRSGPADCFARDITARQLFDKDGSDADGTYSNEKVRTWLDGPSAMERFGKKATRRTARRPR